MTQTSVSQLVQAAPLLRRPFTPAAVRFGIGVSLYAIPSVQVWASQQPDHVRFWKVRDKHQGELTPAGSAALTARYSAWLERVGVAQFGEPLDHGDIEAHPRPTSNAHAVVAEATEALDAVEVTA